MTAAPVLHIRSEAEIHEKLQGGAAIFVSAGVPEPPPDLKPAELLEFEQRNRRYLATAQPAEIRKAVNGITRALLMRGMRLVFGAQPAIGCMVLDIARDLKAKTGSILIFQSEYFKDEIPKSTLELAAWDAGRLVMTPAVFTKGSRKPHRADSLRLMREMMVAVPNVQAAIFIGGMAGIVEEAELFHYRNPKKRMYALASTGSAARDLYTAHPLQYGGARPETAALLQNTSYTVVTFAILEELRAGGADV